MHEELQARLNAEREAIYSWLMSVYKMPATLASTIADQHRIGGELMLWVSDAAKTK